MATSPSNDTQRFRSSPTAHEAMKEYFREHPEVPTQHTHPWDVSRSDIYFADTWQPIFAEMRAKGSLHYIPESPYGPYWAVVRYQAIQHVAASPDVFSSSWKNGGVSIIYPAVGVTEQVQTHLPMFIAMDPPEHSEYRRAVAPVFSADEMRRLEADLRRRTGCLLDTLPRAELFDWVGEVAIELTTGMLAVLFDFPWEDRRLLTFWSDWASDSEVSSTPALDEQCRGFLAEMAGYFQMLWAERVDKAPTPDLISKMIHSETMNQMAPEEFLGNLLLLVFAGNDTTRNTLSGIIHAFDTFPDQRTLFEQDPRLIPNAVQECIRYQTPIAHIRRTATADAEIFGQRIAKNDKVVLWYISGNRDEDVFEKPDALNISRANARRHLSFGHGIHRCIGARLAELQLRVLLEEMHKRRMRVHVAGEVERVRGNFVHGFRRLEVELGEY